MGAPYEYCNTDAKSQNNQTGDLEACEEEIEPVGDKDGERAAVEQTWKVFPRVEPLDVVQSDLDKVAPRGRCRRRVNLHLLDRPPHQRHTQQRHVLLFFCLLHARDADAGDQQLPAGWGLV